MEKEFKDDCVLAWHTGIYLSNLLQYKYYITGFKETIDKQWGNCQVKK